MVSRICRTDTCKRIPVTLEKCYGGCKNIIFDDGIINCDDHLVPIAFQPKISEPLVLTASRNYHIPLNKMLIFADNGLICAWDHRRVKV